MVQEVVQLPEDLRGLLVVEGQQRGLADAVRHDRTQVVQDVERLVPLLQLARHVQLLETRRQLQLRRLARPHHAVAHVRLLRRVHQTHQVLAQEVAQAAELVHAVILQTEVECALAYAVVQLLHCVIELQQLQNVAQIVPIVLHVGIHDLALHTCRVARVAADAHDERSGVHLLLQLQRIELLNVVLLLGVGDLLQARVQEVIHNRLHGTRHLH